MKLTRKIQKKFLRKFPFISQLYKRCICISKNKSNQKILIEFNSCSYPEGKIIRCIIVNLKEPFGKMEHIELNKIEEERKDLLNNNGLLIEQNFDDNSIDSGVTIKQASEASKKSYRAKLLYSLTRQIKPKKVLELGTNVGISSAYIATALKLNNENGELITLDKSPHRIRIAKTVHKNLDLKNISYEVGYFKDTLKSTLERLQKVDLAFIDGHHQYEPTLEYAEEILNFATQDTILIFDDIRWSKEMIKAWSVIQSNERFGLIIDLYKIGICVCKKENISHRYVFPPIHIF